MAVTQGIPENLKQLARAIEYSNPTSFKVGFLKSVFLREEAKSFMDEAPKQVARLMQVGEAYTPKVRDKINDKFCYCKKLGHWEQVCYKKKIDQKRRDDPKKKAHALVTS